MTPSTPTPNRPATARALADALEACSVVMPARKRPAPKAPPEPTVILGPLVAKALTFAIKKHGSQLRKGTTIPYLTHPLAVAALVGESGGNEAEVVAALLHDTVEDGGGSPVLKEIRKAFGPEVAAIVEGCTDDDSGGEKAPWLERKQKYFAHLVQAPLSVLRVSCADKLHNARAIEMDLREHGASVWERFKADREGTLWYYRSLARLFSALIQDEPNLDPGFRHMIRQLREAVGRMEG